LVSLYWLVTGRTIGGRQLYDESNRLDRATALRLWTEGSAWFSTEDGKKGRLVPGQLADFAVLSADYFSVEDEAIKDITSLMTVVGGKIVHAAGQFESLAPSLPPASPDWSPVRTYGGYAAPKQPKEHTAAAAHHCSANDRTHLGDFWSVLGCPCFAV